MIRQLLDTVRKHSKDEGLQDTAIPSLQIYKSSFTNVKVHTIYEPSVCFTVQGSKDVISENETLTYSEGEFIFTSMNLPVCGHITKASTAEPFLSLVLKIDIGLIFETQEKMPVSKSKAPISYRAMFVGKMDESLTDAVLRLVRCLDKPDDIPVLSPLIIRETIYRLLSSEYGGMVAQMGVLGSKMQKIGKAVEFISSRFTEKLDMNNVAKIAGMSTSNFFKNFKETTGMSPLRYQKKIRLQEARQLLMSTNNDAGTVSYLVGYESPSQFSREYSGLFGLPPKTEIKSMKKQIDFLDVS